MKDEALDLIREIAAEHGVALERSDPILIVQTATRKIVQDVLAQSLRGVQESLAQHRSELEAAASKWQSDAKRTATQIVQQVRTESRATANVEVSEASRLAAASLKKAFERHEKIVALSSITCAAAAAIVMIAAAIFVWMMCRSAPKPQTAEFPTPGDRDGPVLGGIQIAQWVAEDPSEATLNSEIAAKRYPLAANVRRVHWDMLTLAKSSCVIARMIFGYVRISPDAQINALQNAALKHEGCKPIYRDEGVSRYVERPQLLKLLERLRAGDVLAVWRLDRLGNSLRDLLEIVARIEARGAALRSITEDIDTTQAHGRIVFHVMAAMGNFERSLTMERTKHGMAAARERGERLGRRPKLSPQQIQRARKLIGDGESAASVARTLGVDDSTLYRSFLRQEDRDRDLGRRSA